MKPVVSTPRIRSTGHWCTMLLVMLLLAGLASRLVNLDAYTGKFDEGIRVEQLFLMSAGFRPVRDIFAGQGPLSLDILYGPFLLFDQTLAAARTGVVIYSLLGLVAVFWVGGLVAGRLGGLLAMLLLVVSPLYLKNSRLALLEVPALVPAVLALGSALLFQGTGQRRWLALSATLLAVALLIKPMVVGVVVPIALALLLRRERRLLDFVQFGGIALVVVGVILALYGPEQVWEQVVVYRQKAGLDSDWSLRENWKIMREELRDEQLPLYGLAALGGLYLIRYRPRWGLVLASWPLVNLGLLLIYSPLQFKHVVTVIPPLTLVLGAAAALAVGQVRASEPRRFSPRFGPLVLGPALVALLVAGAWYLSAAPSLARQHAQVANAETESRVESYPDETRLMSLLSRPDEFVVVDDPIVAFNSRRLVPPNLVDTSHYRIRSGALGGDEMIETLESYDVRLLFLFSDGLRFNKKLDGYVDERYRAIKIYERQNAKDRALYLRDDADLEAARAVLAADIDRPVRAELGGDLRLLGYNLSRNELRAGSSATLTLHWEAIRPMSADYHVITHLRGPNGRPSFQSERGLGGGGEGTASWETGRWVLRSYVLAVPPRAAPGEYELSVALYDSEQRTSPLVTMGVDAGTEEVLLGRLRVR